MKKIVRLTESDLMNIVKRVINEKHAQFAFADIVKDELVRYLENTIYGKVNKAEERANQLIDIHKNFIEKVQDKMSADEIAKRLFKYEKNNLKR